MAEQFNGIQSFSSELSSSLEFVCKRDIITKVSEDEINVLKNRLLKESQHGKLVLNEGKRVEEEFSGPPIPEWLRERPFLSLNYAQGDSICESLAPLGELAVSTQEQSLIDDLLSLMLGCSGSYITVSFIGGEATFSVDSSVEPQLKTVVDRILPLCKYYSKVQSFIESERCYSAGKVNHALTAALRSLVKDYMLLVTQLESQQNAGNLTLMKFWFYIQKTLDAMEVLATLTEMLSKHEIRGGAVLSLLYDRMLSLSGCGHLEELVKFLTEASAVPYMKMLSLWIYRGLIEDPYFEFMVLDNERCKDTSKNDDDDINFFGEDDEHYDDYWEKRYSLSPNVPSFLQSHADIILKTGKYLNVIRDSDFNADCLECKDIVYSVEMKSFSDIVDEAYSFASKCLLQLLMEEKSLLRHLRSIKHYFLLDQGDFAAQLLSSISGELSKNIDDVFPSRLESLLELTLRMSSVSTDVHRDNVHCTLLPYSIMSHLFLILSMNTEEEENYRNPPDRLDLSGLEGFTLTYRVQWPLLLVFDQKSHFCYQMIFRHLFFCKYVEDLLRKVWMSRKVVKEFQTSTAATYRKAFMLAQRMIHFVQSLQYYMFFEVIERYWQIFMSKIEKVENVDEVLKCHSDFINGFMRDCMLQSPQLLKLIIKLLKLCIDFANFNMENQHSISDLPNADENFQQTTAKFDLQFTAMIVTLVDKISDAGRDDCMDTLSHYLCRLDFNNYYLKKSENESVCASPESSIEFRQ